MKILIRNQKFRIGFNTMISSCIQILIVSIEKSYSLNSVKLTYNKLSISTHIYLYFKELKHSYIEEYFENYFPQKIYHLIHC